VVAITLMLGASPQVMALPSAEFTTLDGGAITLAELSHGRWALAFVILPGCPACEEVIEWFVRAAQAFPQIDFLFVTPAATQEFVAMWRASFVEEDAAGSTPRRIPVLLDQDGVLGSTLGVERAPSVFLTMDGMYIDQLDWPFTQQELLPALEESLHVEFVAPAPTGLLGQLATDFSALDLAGTEIALADLPRPLLVSFFNPDCPRCWEIMPALTSLSDEMAVALVVVVAEPPLPAAHRERLKEQLGESLMTLLLVEGFDLLNAYKVTVSPTTILIDEQGVIAWIKEGRIESQDLRDALRAIATEED